MISISILIFVLKLLDYETTRLEIVSLDSPRLEILILILISKMLKINQTYWIEGILCDYHQ